MNNCSGYVFRSQLTKKQTIYPTGFVNDFLSDREKLTMEYFYGRCLEKPLSQPLDMIASNLRISLSTLKRDLHKLRKMKFLHKIRRSTYQTSVYVLHEFYKKSEVIKTFQAFFVTLKKLTSLLYAKAQKQMDGLLLKLKVSYLYSNTLNRMNDRRLRIDQKPERRSFSPVGETYGANDQGQSFARKSFEEFVAMIEEKKLRPFERVSGSDYDEYCFVEEKLHALLTTKGGHITPKQARWMGQVPNGFRNRVSEAEREIGLAIHIDCTCRETPEEFAARTSIKKSAAQPGEGRVPDLKPQITLQEMREHIDLYLHQQPAKREWDTANDLKPSVPAIPKCHDLLEPEPIELYDDTVDIDEWHPNTQNYF